MTKSQINTGEKNKKQLITERSLAVGQEKKRIKNVDLSLYIFHSFFSLLLFELHSTVEIFVSLSSLYS